MNYQIFFAKAQTIIDTPVTSIDKQSAYFLPFLLLNYGNTNPEAAEPRKNIDPAIPIMYYRSQYSIKSIVKEFSLSPASISYENALQACWKLHS